jgi:hypothetical protein
LLQIGNRLRLFRCAVRAAGAARRPADLGRSHGGVIRTGRNIIIFIVVVCGVGGSADASVTVSREPRASTGCPHDVRSSCADRRTYFHRELTYCATTACCQFAESTGPFVFDNPGTRKLAAPALGTRPDTRLPRSRLPTARNSRRSSLPPSPSPYCSTAVARPGISRDHPVKPGP